MLSIEGFLVDLAGWVFIAELIDRRLGRSLRVWRSGATGADEPLIGVIEANVLHNTSGVSVMSETSATHTGTDGTRNVGKTRNAVIKSPTHNGERRTRRPPVSMRDSSVIVAQLIAHTMSVSLSDMSVIDSIRLEERDTARATVILLTPQASVWTVTSVEVRR